MRILAIDPSGNHDSEKEGSGTTGLAYYVNGEVAQLAELKASDYNSTEEYWDALIATISMFGPDHVVFEGYRLYNHRGMSAQTQANSTLLTSQLIGALRLTFYHNEVPYSIQYAAEVKNRWSDAILIHNGYLEEGNRFKGKPTNAHKRDALRHLVHYLTYKQ